MKNQFVEQTAKDYDLPYETVEEIYRKYQDSLYNELESFISDRRTHYNNPLNRMIGELL